MHYQRETLRLDGIDAIVAQHEIDHLDGILISDKCKEHAEKEMQ